MTTFTTTSLAVASYLTACGAPYPTVKTEAPKGVVIFEFQDTDDGEWRREAVKLRFEDTTSDVCLIPAARLFAAQKYLRDDMNTVLGRRR